MLLDAVGWKNIIQRNNLLRGIRLDEGTPTPSFKNAFSIIGGIPRFVVDDSGRVSVTITHSERVRAMAENKFTKVEASASYSFVAASGEYTHRHDTTSTTGSSRSYVIGSWMFPRVIVQLRPEDLKADPDLSRAVRAIVEGEGSAERKYYALRKIFREYGQVWASEVTLGGDLTVSDEVAIDSSSSEESVEDSVRAALSLRVWGAKASAGAAVSNDKYTNDKTF